MAYNVDDFNKILADIYTKIDGLTSDSEEKAVLIESMKNAFDLKSNVEIERLNEFAQELNSIRSLLDQKSFNNGTEDYKLLFEQIKSLEQTFKNEILNITFDKEHILNGLKDDIIKVFEKSSYLDELYPNKNVEYFDDLKRVISDNLSHIQNDIKGNIKEDYEMLAQAIGALYGHLDNLKKDLNANGSAEVTKLSDNIQVIGGNTAGIAIKIDELMNLLSAHSDDKDKLVAMLNSAEGKIDEINAELKNDFASQIEDLKMDLALVTDRIDIVKDELNNSADVNLTQILDGIQSSSVMISDFKKNVSENMVEYLSAIKTALSDFEEQMKSSQDGMISDWTSKNEQDLQNILSEIDKLSETVNTNSISNQKLAEENFELIQQKIADFKQEAFSSSTALANFLAVKFADVEEFLTKKSLLKDEKLEALETTFNEYLADIKNSLGQLDVELKTFDDKIYTKVNEISDNFINLSGKTDEIALNVRTNLSNQISDLKTDISITNDKVDLLKESYAQSSTHNLGQILTGIQSNTTAIDDFKNGVSEHLSEYLTAIKDALESFSDEMKAAHESIDLSGIEQKIEEFKGISQDIKKLDFDLDYKESNYKGYIDEKVEELHNYLVSLEDMFSSTNIGLENSIVQKLSNLEDLISQKDVYSKEEKHSFEELSGVISEVSDKTSKQADNIKEIKALINSVFEEIQQGRQDLGSSVESGKENINLLETNIIEQLKEIELQISEKNTKHKIDTDTKISEITGLISGVQSSISSWGAGNLSKIEERLELLAKELNDNYAEYGGNILSFQEKMGGYVSSVESIVTDVNSKIDGSLTEVVEIKNELKNIFESFEALKADNATEIKETFDKILEKLNDIVIDVEESKTSINDNVKISLQNSIDFVDKGLGYLSSNLGEIKRGQEDNLKNITVTIEDKISSVRDELSLISTDIIQSITEKGENLVAEITPLKVSFDKMLGFDFESIVEEVKKQVELSFLNLSAEINDNLCENQDSYLKIENAYKDIVSRCSSLEDIVNNFTKNNLELIGSTVASVDSNVKLILDSNSSFMDDWKKSIQELNEKLIDSNKEFEHSLVNLFEQIDKTLDEKLLLNQKDLQDYLIQLLDDQKFAELINSSNKELSDKLDSLKLKLEEGVKTEYSPQEIVNSIKLILQESIEILNDKFSAIDTKLDILALNDNSEILEEISSASQNVIDNIQKLGFQIDNLSELDNSKQLEVVSTNCDEIKKSINDLHTKVDVWALTNNEDLQEDIAETSGHVMKLVEELHTKIDILTTNDNSELQEELSAVKELFAKSINELNSKLSMLEFDNRKELQAGIDKSAEELTKSLNELHAKVDVIALNDDSDFQAELDNLTEIFTKSFGEINAKIDILALSDNSDIQNELTSVSDSLLSTIDELHKKVDILAKDDNLALQNDINEIKDLIQSGQKMIDSAMDQAVGEKLDEIIDTLDNSDDKIAKTLELLHNKVDILAMADDNEIKEEIQDIKELISTQKAYFEKDLANEKSVEIGNKLKDLINEINKIEKNISGLDLEKNSQDIKDSVMTAILSAMEQVSFVEETEEIKDFVEEKTNVINQTLMDVKKQLSTISNCGDDMDFYSYTLQDVESDLAKLRLTLNEISSASPASNEFGVISANISKMAKSIEQLQINMAVNNNVPDLKSDFDKLSEDILSLSARTNKILLNSTEAQRIMSLNLEDFANKNIQIQKRLDDFDSKQIESRLSLIEQKVDESVNTSKILQNVMLYLGEWMDGTSETISSIYDKSVKAASAHDLIENLKVAAPEQKDVIKLVEERFEEQESRIDRLEKKLEKALELLSEYDESVITAKIDRIDRQIGKLSENIEKLAAYVDEE